jgi:hypothetical protein
MYTIYVFQPKTIRVYSRPFRNCQTFWFQLLQPPFDGRLQRVYLTIDTMNGNLRANGTPKF